MGLLGGIRFFLGTVVALFILNVLFESNVRHFIEHHGWDTLLTRAFTKVHERRGFWFVFGIAVGATVMAWVLPEMSLPKSTVGLAVMGAGALIFLVGAYLLPSEAPSPADGQSPGAPPHSGILATVIAGAGGAGGGGPGGGAGGAGGSGSVSIGQSAPAPPAPVAPAGSAVPIAGSIRAPAQIFPSRSPADADAEIKVIDEVLAILNDDGPSQATEGLRLSSGWWNALADPAHNENYQTDLAALRDSLNSTQAKLASLRNKNTQYFDGDISLIIDRLDYNDINRALENFRAAFGALKYVADLNKVRQVGSEISRLQKPHADAFDHAVATYRDWLTTSKKALLDRRAVLSDIASRREP